MYEDSLFILWFMAFGIFFNIDLEWLESTFMYAGGIAFTKRFEGAVI